MNIVRACAAAALLPVLALGGAAMAHADTAGQQALVDRYASLSGALINVQARAQSLSIGDYLKNTSATLYTLPSSSGPSAMTVLASKSASIQGGVSLQAASLEDLNRQLVASGAAFDNSDFASMNALAQAVTSKATSADAQVVAASASWVNALSSMTAPTLTAPSTAVVDQPGIPADALPFGLLMDKSLTQLAVDAPDLLAKISATGVGSVQAAHKFGSAMSAAWATSGKDVEQTVADPCSGGMLAVMATGQASSAERFGNCGTGCVAGGMYLHNQSLGLFDPGRNSVLPNPVTQGLNAAGVQALPPAMQAAISAQTPAPSSQSLAGLLSSNGTACSTASTNAQGILGSSLPSVWGTLR